MVEIGAVLVRRGSKLETINPELDFDRLVFVFLLRHFLPLTCGIILAVHCCHATEFYRGITI